MDDFSLIFNSSPSRLIYEKLKNMSLTKIPADVNPPLQNPPTTQPILIYKALLSQVDEEPPTAIELQNTIGVTPIFTYQDPGIYIMTFPGVEPLPYYATIVNMNICQITNGGFWANKKAGTALRTGDTQVQIHTGDIGTNMGEDNLLNFTPIEILVYQNITEPE